jgi:hypothetical protein
LQSTASWGFIDKGTAKSLFMHILIYVSNISGSKKPKGKI